MTTAPTPAQATTQAGDGAANNTTAAPAAPAATTPPATTTETPAAPADPAKPAEGAAPAAASSGNEPAAKPNEEPGKPAEIKLELPDDLLLDDADVERIEAEAKAQGLTKDQAQAILVRENSAVKKFADAQTAEHDAVKAKWVEEISKDKEIGGDDYKKNVELSHRVVKRFGSERLVTELETTGLGNNPELVRLLTRIGKTMSEDTLIVPGSQPSAQPKDMATIFYGESTKQN